MKKITAFILGILSLTCFALPALGQNANIQAGKSGTLRPISYKSTTPTVQIDTPKIPCPDKNGVISSSSYKINYIYPTTQKNTSGMLYPGSRGPNQLVIYKRDFGKNTGTNEYGREAIVEGDIVVKISGANSTIPNNGYVISGHGNAKKWISDNIKIGTKIKIDEFNKVITAYTTVDSYRFYAEENIKEVERIIKASKTKNSSSDEDKEVKKYLKKAKQYAKKAKNGNEKSLLYAQKAIEMADCALNYSLPYIENELKGVWIRPTETRRTEIERTLDEMQRTGINAVFLETFFHGKTIFPSTTMAKYNFIEQNEIFKGIDPLAIWTEEAHKRGIKVHIWFQSFYVGNKPIYQNDKTILSVKPEWANKDKANYNSEDITTHKIEHNGYFLDPANCEVTNFLEELLYEISARYAIDGINLDYVRYPTSAKPTSSNYENSNWGYTKYAREEFKSIYNVDPVDVAYNTPLWNEWSKYRQQKIANYVKYVASTFKNRGITVSAVVFPEQENGVATKQQNWEYWTKNTELSALTPLILTADHELSLMMIKGIKKNIPTDIKIYTGLFVPFMEGTGEDLLKQIHITRSEKLDGVIIFDWSHFDNKYKEILKSSAFLPGTNTNQK